jgi:alkyl sulfatase BDS1-like metallo-beta-lactamase superfamily hydrolase
VPDLLALSARFIDESGDAPGPTNRVTNELSVVADGVSVVESFSHAVSFDTDDGLVVFDTSGDRTGPAVVQAIRGWSGKRFNTLVYTHGHIDHVGGCGAFCSDASHHGHPVPRIVGHENVPKRFDRYNLTNGYNNLINARQFRGFQRRGYGIGSADRFLPVDSLRPDTTYRDAMSLSVGGVEFDLHHAKGETDDHTWAWVPKYKAICAGDFFIWNFPNAGNPQKVQRFPVEWAKAMRDMAGMGAELFLPAHGLPIAGAARIRRVLTEVAEVLEQLVSETLAMMNAGAKLNDVIHTVKVEPARLARPYLRPLYDEPEFVVRNIWRLYGGWYDGNPANLKPARESALALELAQLAGGTGMLVKRALELSASGDHRLACHLVEFAVLAAPDDRAAHAARAQVYQARRDTETSLMAKGIFGYTAGESLDRSGG